MVWCNIKGYIINSNLVGPLEELLNEIVVSC